MLPDFRLEAHFSRWEFAVRHHLTASDAETIPMGDLLALADEDDQRAWRDLRLGYTETFGDPELRAAIAATYQRVDAADVLCFAGAEEGIYLAMRTLLGPADHAVVLTPNYQSAETVPLALCEVTGIALDPERNWALDVSAVRAALRPNTRVVSVNFPNNPTGKIIEAATFRELATLCDERGVHLFSDEVFRGIERDPARTLPQAADLSERALSLNVVSKSYGLPGLRVGWIACRDRKLLSRLERAKHYTSLCNSAPSEILARIAVKAGDALMGRNRRIVAENIVLLEAFLREFPGWCDFTPPAGGCVCFPRYHGPGDVEWFCRSLVEQAGVLLLPASLYRSELTPVPTDRFRIGLGRLGMAEALDALGTWLRDQR